MSKFSEEVSELFDKDNEFAKIYEKMDIQLKKLKCVEYMTMDALVEEYDKSDTVKYMRLDRVRCKVSGTDGEYEHYIRLLYMDSDRKYVVQSAQQIFDGNMISLGFIMKVQELAYMGYQLVQSKEWYEEEVSHCFEIVEGE